MRFFLRQRYPSIGIVCPDIRGGCTHAAEARWLVCTREDATASQAKTQVFASLPMSTGQQPGSSISALAPGTDYDWADRTALRSSAVLICRGPSRAAPLRPTHSKISINTNNPRL